MAEARRKQVQKVGRLCGEMASTGAEPFVPSRYELRKVVKENHGEEVEQVLVNRITEKKDNLVATVGFNQASIYDNDNWGYLDLVSNFTNNPTEYTSGGVRQALACLLRK